MSADRPQPRRLIAVVRRGRPGGRRLVAATDRHRGLSEPDDVARPESGRRGDGRSRAAQHMDVTERHEGGGVAAVVVVDWWSGDNRN